MESIQEQIFYGGHCKHGTAIGTPGGADLMCGLCEDGYDTWVSDQQYILWFRFTDAPLNDDSAMPWLVITQWWDSTPQDRKEQILEGHLRLFREVPVSASTMSKLQHKVTLGDTGYWDRKEHLTQLQERSQAQT